VRVCGAHGEGCGGDIPDGQPRVFAQRLRVVRNGSLLDIVEVGSPHPFHPECAPRGDVMWKILLG
jgi:hypothetical protein